MNNLAFKYPASLPEASFYEIEKAAEAVTEEIKRCMECLETEEDVLPYKLIPLNLDYICERCDDKDRHADDYDERG